MTLEPPTDAELDECPFCAGREDRTPPETLRIGEPWQVRVVPNLFPAFDRQEVVIHSPRHVRSFAELTEDEAGLVAEAWQQRRSGDGSGYLHAFVNEGRAGGASLAHSHSQLVWLRSAPAAAQHGVERERWSVVVERDELVLACPYASRLPYECVIAPAEPRPNAFTDPMLPVALRLLRDAARRLHRVLGPVPFNAWLHDGSDWHLELLPRATVLAGLELGAEIYINTMPPEGAAARLR